MATADAAEGRGREAAAPERPPVLAVPLFLPPDPWCLGGGHTVPIGRTGAGKSVLVALMAGELRRRAALAADAADAGGAGR